MILETKYILYYLLTLTYLFLPERKGDWTQVIKNLIPFYLVSYLICCLQL